MHSIFILRGCYVTITSSPIAIFLRRTAEISTNNNYIVIYLTTLYYTCRYAGTQVRYTLNFPMHFCARCFRKCNRYSIIYSSVLRVSIVIPVLSHLHLVRHFIQFCCTYRPCFCLSKTIISNQFNCGFWQEVDDRICQYTNRQRR